MRCSEIAEIIQQSWPLDLAMEWDNVGLLLGRQDKEVAKIFVCLDVTEETLELALEAGADMIISHHPIIISGLKKITDQEFIGRKLLKIMARDIACYAMHTNFDVVSMGELNKTSLGLKDCRVLEVTALEEGLGIGQVGTSHEALSLSLYGDFVREALGLPHVLVYGDMTKEIKRVAVSGGSGKSAVNPALAAKADLLITGDIDYHSAIDANAQGLAVIDAGHYGTEYTFISYMAEKLGEIFPEVEVVAAPIKQPYLVI